MRVGVSIWVSVGITGKCIARVRVRVKVTVKVRVRVRVRV